VDTRWKQYCNYRLQINRSVLFIVTEYVKPDDVKSSRGGPSAGVIAVAVVIPVVFVVGVGLVIFFIVRRRCGHLFERL
jgi:hypothetical protein